MSEESQISKFYANKKVLVTGGTGFMGKVLIWKLLHSCPQLDTIFVLIRPKYAKPAISRKEDVFRSQIFDNFKKENPQILDKVVFIAGDVGENEIGLSEADRCLLIEEVSIIFHSAAILKMDADLKTAVNVNLVGTMRMLELAMQMKKLEAFVYNSTAYCCCENTKVEEKIYPVKHSPHEIIKLTHWMEPEILKKITPELIHPLPNTYIYTKRLTESLLPEYRSKVPIIVARPSIVLPAYSEPLPGWNDNLNGPGAFFIIGGKGLLRTTMMNRDGKCTAIPVDTAINALIALPWTNPKEELMKEISVCNVSQTAFSDVTWGEAVPMAVESFNKYPFDKILWYPTSDPFTKSILVYTLKCIFLHYLPAYIIDFIMVLIGEKRFMVRAHEKLRQGERVLRYFTQQDWDFIHDKRLQLDKQMNDTDKTCFNVNLTQQQIGSAQNYMDVATYGAKVYIFKEDLKNMSSAKRLANVMFVIDRLSYLLKLYLLWKILTFLYSIFLGVIQLYHRW